MHSVLSKSLLQRSAHSNFMFRQAQRAFSSNSVTYELKDLILDPEQKGKPLYETYLLDPEKMPKTATTNKDELMAYLKRMI